MQCFYRFLNKTGLRELDNVHYSCMRTVSSYLQLSDASPSFMLDDVIFIVSDVSSHVDVETKIDWNKMCGVCICDDNRGAMSFVVFYLQALVVPT